MQNQTQEFYFQRQPKYITLVADTIENDLNDMGSRYGIDGDKTTEEKISEDKDMGKIMGMPNKNFWILVGALAVIGGIIIYKKGYLKNNI